MSFSHDALKRQISEGILAFPATPFDASDRVDLGGFQRHLTELAAYRPTAIVAVGGAGELFSLTQAEHRSLAKAATKATPSIPVIVGIGFGVALACEMARAAEEEGAAAVLLFPPYLVESEQEGLAHYIEAVCRAASIAVIVYSRGNGILTPDTSLRLAETCPNLIAVKDGTGDFEALAQLKRRAGDRLALINGVPTAELIAAECFSLGIRSYTSAVFTFLPALAVRFYEALRGGDDDTVEALLEQFYVPLGAIRRRRHGYAVAIVKAGLRMVGKSAGPVRPPLVEVSREDERDLSALIERAADLLKDAAVGSPVRAAR